jgi:hypothetical protein
MQTRALGLFLIVIICLQQYNCSVFATIPVVTSAFAIAFVKGITEKFVDVVDSIIPDILQPRKWGSSFLDASAPGGIDSSCLKADNQEETNRFAELNKASDAVLKSYNPEELTKNIEIFDNLLSLNLQLSGDKFNACTIQEKKHSIVFQKGLELINSHKDQIKASAKEIGNKALQILLEQAKDYTKKLGIEVFDLINPFN